MVTTTRGYCGLHKDVKVPCNCNRFRGVKRLPSQIEALRQRDVLASGDLNWVTWHLREARRKVGVARKRVRDLEGEYQRANKAYAQAHFNYEMAQSSSPQLAQGQE